MKFFLAIVMFVASCNGYRVDECAKLKSSGNEASSPYLFNYDGKPYVWPHLKIEWGFVCEFPKEYIDDVRDGFEHWNKTINVDLFEELDGCFSPGQKFDMILITWSGVSHPLSGTCNRTILGTARRFFDYEYVEINSGVVTFWLDWFSMPIETRRTIARHEVGHALGLQHITEDKMCIMYPYVSVIDSLKNGCIFELDVLRHFYGPKESTDGTDRQRDNVRRSGDVRRLRYQISDNIDCAWQSACEDPYQ